VGVRGSRWYLGQLQREATQQLSAVLARQRGRARTHTSRGYGSRSEASRGAVCKQPQLEQLLHPAKGWELPRLGTRARVTQHGSLRTGAKGGQLKKRGKGKGGDGGTTTSECKRRTIAGESRSTVLVTSFRPPTTGCVRAAHLALASCQHLLHDLFIPSVGGLVPTACEAQHEGFTTRATAPLKRRPHDESLLWPGVP
jgi:hypothetical protein